MDIRIGTSGYHYTHWVRTYYPEGTKPKDMLAHYMRDFETVERNRPFYRLPTRKAFEDWREALLQTWADWLLARRDTLRAAYVYFDNDAEANAVRDALALKEIVSEQ